jgi:FtsP/CotA-like multicopper oxidase with cupredoxin domain
VPRLTRRRLLAALPAAGAGAAALHAAVPHSHGGAQAAAAEGSHAGHGGGGGKDGAHPGHDGKHATFRGAVDHARNGFDPHEVLRDFDWGTTRKLPDGRTLREWELTATQKDIEVAPGVTFAAWVYNGRIPGPTLRAKEGERLRITFRNATPHPHTIHFHGLHPDTMDGVAGTGAGEVAPGGFTVYEFDAEPFGLHLYHCHVRPLAEHIQKGLYGAFVIDPKQGREPADEMVMVMHGLDTNFDRENEIYAVNGIGFAYMDPPIKVKRNELVRINLVNVTEFDPINSFHVHGNFFNYFPTGTSLQPIELTDTVMQCQGQRGILELRFPRAGRFMFHAHQSEFTELGWQGFFEVTD